MPLTNVDTEFMAVLFHFLVTACDSSFAKNARRIQRTAMRRMHGHAPVKWQALHQMQRCATETVAFFLHLARSMMGSQRALHSCYTPVGWRSSELLHPRL